MANWPKGKREWREKKNPKPYAIGVNTQQYSIMRPSLTCALEFALFYVLYCFRKVKSQICIAMHECILFLSPIHTNKVWNVKYYTVSSIASSDNENYLQEIYILEPK